MRMQSRNCHFPNLLYDMAIKICIEQGILTDFLIRYQAEVTEMILSEYDEERHMSIVKKHSEEKGRKEGRKEAETELNALTLALIRQGRVTDLEKAASDPEFQKQLLNEFGLKKELTDEQKAEMPAKAKEHLASKLEDGKINKEKADSE